MSMKCMEKDCVNELMLISINDGEDRLNLCFHHATIFASDERLITLEEKAPQICNSKLDKLCDCCSEAALEASELDPFNEDVTWNLCMDHLKKLLTHQLNREEYKSLYNIYGDVYLLHDDFYNVATGRAFHPVGDGV